MIFKNESLSKYRQKPYGNQDGLIGGFMTEISPRRDLFHVLIFLEAICIFVY